MSTIDTFAEDLHGYLAPEQVAQVVRAYDFAEEAHEGQTRKSVSLISIIPLPSHKSWPTCASTTNV